MNPGLIREVPCYKTALAVQRWNTWTMDKSCPCLLAKLWKNHGIFWITWLCLNHFEWYRFESKPMIAYEWRDEHWEQPAVSIYDIQDNKASVLIYGNFWMRQPVVDFSVIRLIIRLFLAIFSGFPMILPAKWWVIEPCSDHRLVGMFHKKELWSTGKISPEWGWPEMSRVNDQFIILIIYITNCSYYIADMNPKKIIYPYGS